MWISSKNENESTVLNPLLRDSPSCSKDNCIKNDQATDKVNNKVFPILDIDKLGRQKYIECLSNKLVCNLEKCVENEKLYIESFDKLLKFTECCKNVTD